MAVLIKISLSERPIAYYPTLAKLLGGAEEAIFVQQLMYWMERCNDNDGWVYKLMKDWISELGLTEKRIRRIRRNLKNLGVLEEEVRKDKSGIQVVHYRINQEKLLEILGDKGEVTNDGNPPLPNGKGGSCQMGRGAYQSGRGVCQSGTSLPLYNNIDYTENTHNINNTVASSKQSSLLDEDEPINDKDKEYIPLAKELAEIIRTKKKIKVRTQRIKSWAHEIRMLVERDLDGDVEDNLSRVKRALEWYRENIGGEYVPVIESGRALRDKFVKLERAMERKSTSYRESSIPRSKDNESPSDLYSYENLRGCSNFIEIDLDEYFRNKKQSSSQRVSN